MDPEPLTTQAHSSGHLVGLLILVGLLALVVLVGWRAWKHARKVEAEKAAQAQRRNELAASRDPRPQVKREAGECRHCASKATEQQPRYVFDPETSWWERVLGRGGETFVRLHFDSDYPVVLCSACCAVVRSAMANSLAQCVATEAGNHAAAVQSLTMAQDVDIPTAVHGAMDGLRRVQDSFAKRGAPPAPRTTIAPDATEAR